MPGLSFLSKKSWHTSNIKNVEKVWIAEQKADQERRKLDELQKQLEEERQIQELRQLQAANGQSIKVVDTSLDWMYEGPSAAVVQNQQAEEYLLGKVFKQPTPSTFEVATQLKQSSQEGTKKWMEKVSTKTDMFSRMHEDPLMMIKQREKQQRDQVLINPIKMSQIRQNIARELEQHESHKTKKESKKHKHKKEKKSKKDKRENEDDHPRKRKYRGDESSDDDNTDEDSLKESSMGSSGLKYGLQNKTLEKKDYLGPRPDLLQQRDAKRQKEIHDRNSQSNYHKLSNEERESRVKIMEESAERKYQSIKNQERYT